MTRIDVDASTMVLGIESSCDETAAAVVVGGSEVRSNVVSSQVDLHASFGGVVPEIAGRAHEQQIAPVISEALVVAGAEAGDIDAVAATVGPGLIGSLLVGVSAAKALSLVWGVPFVGVNHLEAHFHASMLDAPELELPLVILLVSGGHTMLVRFDGPGSYQLLGSTRDDAAGEAFDKVARFVGLGYPGGPAIDAAALAGDPESVRLPRPMLADDHLDFSFSGLKTAVINHVRAHPDVAVDDIAASFQAAAVDVLVTKTMRAAESIGAAGVCLAGGVAANSLLRARTAAACDEAGLASYLPSREMCTDNAAMVAAAGWWNLHRHGADSLDTGADPRMRISFT